MNLPAIPIQMINFLGSMLICILATFWLINILFGGLLFPYISVFRSKGKKVLVQCFSPARNYWIATENTDGEKIKFKLNRKDKEAVTIPNSKLIENAYYRMGRVACLNYDVASGKIIDKFRTDVDEHDKKKADNLIERALMMEKLGDDFVKKVIFALVIIILLLIAVAWLVWDVRSMIKVIGNHIFGVT